MFDLILRVFGDDFLVVRVSQGIDQSKVKTWKTGLDCGHKKWHAITHLRAGFVFGASSIAKFSSNRSLYSAVFNP